MTTWKLYTYELFGSEVNNVYGTSHTYESESDDGNEAWDEIRKQMIKDGVLHHKNKIEPDNNSDHMHCIYLVDVSKKCNGYQPIAELRKID